MFCYFATVIRHSFQATSTMFSRKDFFRLFAGLLRNSTRKTSAEPSCLTSVGRVMIERFGQRNTSNRTLSHNAATKDFARPTSHSVRGWTGKNKAFCSPGTQNGTRVIKVYWPTYIIWRTLKRQMQKQSARTQARLLL